MNLQEDLKNYMRVELYLTANILLKKGTLPHIFKGQPNRKRASSKPTRAGVLKFRKFRVLAEVEQQHQAQTAIQIEEECQERTNTEDFEEVNTREN
ncbi:uncharacterized protein LOC117167433 isoform X2 [Belonocnema kinseyi]|uniref:uncharacterized protein LOC117167433 isoform X2 n=1 Tax=Belonocnema kinseyi TaxID=2817044 RepID=UPI00143D48AB|nr:uncharacterized protein LOC117167433 isoform X2 [Belonocnema kinseyi]